MLLLARPWLPHSFEMVTLFVSLRLWDCCEMEKTRVIVIVHEMMRVWDYLCDCEIVRMCDCFWDGEIVSETTRLQHCLWNLDIVKFCDCLWDGEFVRLFVKLWDCLWDRDIACEKVRLWDCLWDCEILLEFVRLWCCLLDCFILYLAQNVTIFKESQH